MTVPFIANHLWQSSGFALAGGLLAFVLRRNSPRVRYWIWLSASLKFLVPFALLVSVGSLIPRAAPHTVSVPFPLFPNTVIQIAAPLSAASDVTRAGPTELYWLPVALGVIWALGFLAITLVRWRGWLRVRALLRAGTPIELQIPVRALITPGAEEPGVVGFLRPVLVLPAQLLERLNARQLGAILAHELCHVRRRDNFFAAVHMVVEAIFWFNPLVWWIGSRMVEERELACDEEVLRTGCEPADYVEGILQVCRFYTESPLPCVSGVTGADVKKRLSAILAGTIALELSGAKKLTLATISVAVLTTPVLVGVLTAPVVRAQNATATVKFEVASIKLYKDDGVGDRGLHNSYRPQSVGFRCSLAFAIGDAYNFPVGRIVGPGSLTKEALWGALQQIYDIEARAEEPVSKAQLRLMMQSLLADRFKLTMHREARTSPVYKLTVAKDGPRMEESKRNGDFNMSASNNGFVFTNAEMIRLSGFLTGRVDRTVVDQTDLKGLYNFNLKMPDDLREGAAGVKSDGISAESPSAGAFAGPLKSLGLQLVAGTAPVDYLVVDHVESPSGN
ncbi:MAG TPA: M56 family metallopeptidase [Bryobacteraceae bacterium]|nr:M56 family metallopeptidase [Bryobacteraceae bacterium]